MSLDIPATAKKYARDLLDKMTEKRCAHLSDLEEAFTRAITEAAPKTNPWGYPVAMTPEQADQHKQLVDHMRAGLFGGEVVVTRANTGKYVKWNTGSFPAQPVATINAAGVVTAIDMRPGSCGTRFQEDDGA